MDPGLKAARLEHSHQQFFERNRTVQLLIDPDDGRVLEANPAACAFYGYSHAELTSLRIWQINVLPEPQVRDALRRALEDWGRALHFSHRLASGELRQVEVHTGPLQVAERVLLYSLIFDVTERLRAEAALQRQLAAFESSMDGMAVLDERGEYQFVNQAHARIYGYERPADLIGLSWHVLYSGAELQRIESLAMPLLRRDGRWRGEAVGRRRDGATFAQEISLTSLAGGGLVCVVRDVSERHAAEEALRKSEEKYRAILENIEDGYYEADLNGAFSFCNESLCRMLGLTLQQVFGRHFRSYTTPRAARRMYRDFRRVLKSEQPLQNAEWEVQRSDGRPLSVAASLSLLRDAAGLPVGFRGMVRDVSARKRSETALRESEDRYRQLVELSPLGIATHSAGVLDFINEAGLRMLGAQRPEQLLGRRVMEFVHPDSLAQVAERTRRLTLGQQVGLAEERFVRLDGSALDVVVAAMSFSRRGRPAIQMVAADISEQKRNQRLQASLYRIAATSASVENMAELYGQIHAIVGELMYARNFYIALYDAATCTLSFPYHVDQLDALPPPQPLGRGLTEYVLRTGQPLLADPAVFQGLLEAGEVQSLGANSLDWLGVPLLSGGSAFGVLVVQSYSASRRFSDAERELLTFVSQHVASAIQRQRAAEALRESEARFRTLAQTAPCAILIYREAGFLYANDAALEVTGRSRQELQHINLWELVSPDLSGALRERELERLRGAHAQPDRFELRLIQPGGSARWLDYSVGLIHYEGQPAILATAFDISERKRAEEQVRHLAYHDALTGLPNRLLFRDRLEMAVAQARRDGRRVGLLFLDLDRFKAINDSLGHSQGDRLLQDVARRLERSVREGDTVARLSGDEFTLILPGVGQGLDAAKAAEKLLDLLRQPFELKGREVFVTASMGISLYPEDGHDAETLTKNADTAMYRAKEEGRDGYQLYAPGMNAQALERLALESSLRRALQQGELSLEYQPMFDPLGTRVYAIEALLRWCHLGRQIAPAEFIPLAELTGLIVPIGRWVLRRACTQARLWQQHGHAALRVAVNLSAREFQQPDLTEQVRQALAESGLPAHCLELEVTESSAMQNSAAASQTLHQLKAVGVRLSIDDFGIGYSSLAYLKHLPFDTLKIDQSFVQDLLSDPDDAAIVSAVIEMAHALKRQVVAEGVQTEEQRAFLAARGCDGMQGFLFSRPLPPDELGALLERTAG